MLPFTGFVTFTLVLSQFYLADAQFGHHGFNSGSLSGGGFASQSSSGFNRGFSTGGGGFGGGGFGGGFGGGGGGFSEHSSGFQQNSASGGGFNSQHLSGGVGFRSNEKDILGSARYATPYDSPAYAPPPPRAFPCPKNILISCTPQAQALPCVQTPPIKY